MNPNIVTLEIRPGPGGDEARFWAADLLRMYARYAGIKNWKITYIDEGIIKIVGEGAYDALKHEAGVHRVQRVPETEKRGRIHTSTASVAVLVEIPEQAVNLRPEEIEMQFYRSSSKGGQNVQKVSTAVRLKHLPSGIVVTAQSERFQEQNRANALSILRSKLWEIEEDKRIKALGDQRAIIGRAMRNEKVRTYNFLQDRLTDHRINKSFHQLENLMEGKIDKLIDSLKSLN